jgi:UPF0755 protein
LTHIVIAIVTGVVTMAAVLVYLLFAPHGLPAGGVDIKVPVGASSRSVAKVIVEAGVDVAPWMFVGAVELGGLRPRLRPGHYHFRDSVSLWSVIDAFRRGNFERSKLLVPEGITFAELRRMVSQTADLRHETTDWTDVQLAHALNLDPWAPEGWFAPDTYDIDPDSADLAFYRTALSQQRKRLEAAWSQRAPDLPYRQTYDALIMASLIEKETGLASDRPMISAVFVNRQRLGMPLQTDPSVIYGLGDKFQGRLHRVDLLADTAFNTYTRRGLPPTPIALPGREAILAALHPANSKALYFVSRGDGSSAFSETLAQHNQAVHLYVKGNHG